MLLGGITIPLSMPFFSNPDRAKKSKSVAKKKTISDSANTDDMLTDFVPKKSLKDRLNATLTRLKRRPLAAKLRRNHAPDFLLMVFLFLVVYVYFALT